MDNQKLSPGCMIAHAMSNNGMSRNMSIEYMRLIMESAPTFPATWTLQDGIDYLAAFTI